MSIFKTFCGFGEKSKKERTHSINVTMNVVTGQVLSKEELFTKKDEFELKNDAINKADSKNNYSKEKKEMNKPTSRHKSSEYVTQPKTEKKSRNYVCQPDIKLSDYEK